MLRKTKQTIFLLRAEIFPLKGVWEIGNSRGKLKAFEGIPNRFPSFQLKTAERGMMGFTRFLFGFLRVAHGDRGVTS